MRKPVLYVMVRERPLRTHPDWKACHTYVTEYLATDGQWYSATNSARRFTRDEARSMSPRPWGEYFERENACQLRAKRKGA